MTLRFDPEGIDRFKAQIRAIPGYPAGEDLPIREMVFEFWGTLALAQLASTSRNETRPPFISCNGSDVNEARGQRPQITPSRASSA